MNILYEDFNIDLNQRHIFEPQYEKPIDSGDRVDSLRHSQTNTIMAYSKAKMMSHVGHFDLKFCSSTMNLSQLIMSEGKYLRKILRQYGFKTTHEKKSSIIQPIKLPAVPGLLGIKSPDQLLVNHSGLIKTIDELAGLSKDNYDRYYLTAIQNFARFVQQLPASEVHHHAGPGGMLTHCLEVCVFALKVRRSYLLSETGGAEEIAQKQDLWTYAVFIAALCHDLAKVAVDQVVTIYDEQDDEQQWELWDKYIDEQGKGYTTEFVRHRQYRLHEKASPLLIHKIVPSHGMKWISSDQTIFSRWLACISGDIANASSIGEIISIADSKSVAENLGADNNRMPTVKTKPLHEKMLTALRHLLMEGELPLNRNGAAGWIKGDDCWLVSKRTVDAIREQLTQEGHTGIPTKNGRLFDILQEHGVIIPTGDKAIWSVTITGEGWSHDLTLIKVATNKIWTNPANKPDDFEGDIIAAEIKALDEKKEEINHVVTQSESAEKPIPKTKPASIEDDQGNSSVSSVVENAEVKSPESLDQLQTTLPDDESELLAFLPSLNADGEDNVEVANTEKFEKKQLDSDVPKTTTMITQPEATSIISNKSKEEPFIVQSGIENHIDQVSVFFEWLQHGIQNGSLKTNQAKARIHTVDEGVILITPGIFQDFVKTQEDENSNWTAIQQIVLKKNWHVRNDKGLNVVKYQVKGQSKQTTVNAILFKDLSKVFGSKLPPTSNPHLSRLD